MSTQGSTGTPKIPRSPNNEPNGNVNDFDPKPPNTEKVASPQKSPRSSISQAEKKNPKKLARRLSFSPNGTNGSLLDSLINRNILPEVPEQPQRYTPMPYTFRVPSNAIRNNENITHGRAQSPPFNLQVDHMLAVVWSLFSNTTTPKPLGIAQLQWALSFLRTIVNRRGEHPKDVEICIQVIQDQLIELYGGMVDEVTSIEKSRLSNSIRKNRNKQTIPTTPETMDASYDNSKSAIPANNQENANQSQFGNVVAAPKPQTAEGLKQSPFDVVPSVDGAHGAGANMSAYLSAMRQNEANPGNVVRNSQLLPAEVSNDISYEERDFMAMPFSITYADVSASTPNNTRRNADSSEEPAQSGEPVRTDVCSQEMLEYLRNWRQDQYRKIQAEVEQLHSVDKVIGLCEKNNQESFATQDISAIIADKTHNTTAEDEASHATHHTEPVAV